MDATAGGAMLVVTGFVQAEIRVAERSTAGRKSRTREAREVRGIWKTPVRYKP
jgi:hypothetical protein